MKEGWVAVWHASIAGIAGISDADATYRQRIDLPCRGSLLRLRLTNPGSERIAFDALTIQFSDGSVHPVSVGGGAVIIPPRSSVRTDPVDVPPLSNQGSIVVATYARASVPFAWHPSGTAIQARTAAGGGDRTGSSVSDGFNDWFSSTAWIDTVEVFTNEIAGCVVVLGDSITDGACVPLGTRERWVDRCTDGLAELHEARRHVVLSAGIDGNTLCGVSNELIGPAGVDRAERDLFDLAGITGIVLFEGTNDVATGVPATCVIDAIRLVAAAAIERRLDVVICTLIPRAGGVRWTSEKERHRLAVNSAMRASEGPERLLDFESVLADGGSPLTIGRPWDADGTHPTSAGHARLARAYVDDYIAVSPPST